MMEFTEAYMLFLLLGVFVGSLVLGRLPYGDTIRDNGRYGQEKER